MTEKVEQVSSASNLIIHRVESNSDMLEHLSNSSETVHSISLSNAQQLEEISSGLGRLETLLRAQSRSSRYSDPGISPSQDSGYSSHFSHAQDKSRSGQIASYPFRNPARPR